MSSFPYLKKKRYKRIMNKSAAFFVENYYSENSLFARSMFLDVQYSD